MICLVAEEFLTLLQNGISEPLLYGDLVYKFKRIVGNLGKSTCLDVNPITVV